MTGAAGVVPQARRCTVNSPRGRAVVCAAQEAGH